MINDKLKQVADLMQECVKAGKMEWKNDHGDWYEWRGDDLPNIAMFENGTIRPHDPLREFKEAFAHGESVERLIKCLGEWVKIDSNEDWSSDVEHYRFAPQRWYRVALKKDEYTITLTQKSELSEKEVENRQNFDRWLTDRVYY